MEWTYATNPFLCNCVQILRRSTYQRRLWRLDMDSQIYATNRFLVTESEFLEGRHTREAHAG
jgi:hypothetical protein